MTTPSDNLLRAAESIRSADGLLVTAGAGMGVDSGLPDFRGNEGFWKAYPALGRRKLDFHSVASPDTFRSNIRLAWGFYGHRLALYRATVPHAGFALLQRWGSTLPHGFFVFTSNVDGQFQTAGVQGGQLLECHGSIHHLQCLEGCSDDIWPADALQPEIDNEECMWRGEIPACIHCGGRARPNILMFGDWGWLSHRAEVQRDHLRNLESCQHPVVIELGAGVDIATVRSFSERVAGTLNSTLVRINPKQWEVPRTLDIGLPMGALAGLEAIDRKMTRR
jgi:NAD-dependent SIR2 family protein deacetylase